MGEMMMQDLFDIYPEWVGMPEFVQEKKQVFKEVVVRFETEEDFIDFQKLINQKMTLKTKSIWHPFKSHWGLERKVYKDAA
jgi:hypothetical protein